MNILVKRLYRVTDIIFAFGNFYWQACIVLRGNTEAIQLKRAKQLKKTIEQLGSVFIKFGQLLALRPDFIPLIYCNELFFLLENVPPFPYIKVIEIFQEEFGRNPEDMFAKFDENPLAAASFGQVHSAILKTGEKVAVKIQRPHIKQLVEEDIILMKILAKISDFVRRKSNKLFPVVKEFEEWTREELDYTVEAHHTEEYYQDVKNNPDTIYGPKVFKNYSSKKIITTEFIEGITLSKILFAYRQHDTQILKKLKQSGFDRKTVAEKFLKESLKQIYLKGFFHADPHPANIIFMPDGRLAYIDFGIYGHLDKRTRVIHMRYARSVIYGDTENSFQALLAMCDTSKVTDFVGFKKDHDAKVHMVFADFTAGQKRGTPQIMGKVLFETLDVLQKYHAILPLNTLRHFRSLATRESIVLHLYPEMKLDELARQWRNVSIVNLIDELPHLVTTKHLNKHILQWLNMLEEEVSNKQ